MLKVIFFGTPEYVIPILSSLYKNYKVVGVVTQPPKLVGRKQLKTFTPVDTWAFKRKLPVFKGPDFKVKDLAEADLGVVAAYGKIIPQNIIDHFKYGILNIHPSLLPKYRGASPIQSQIADGESQTGVSIIKMNSKMDNGPIVSQFKEDINNNDTNESLRNRLFERSAQFLIDLMPNYLNGRIILKPQKEENATFTKIITRENGYVDLKKDNHAEVERKFRAYHPWPGIYTKISDSDGQTKRLKILELHLDSGKLVLDKVQMEGKKAVSFSEFKRGYPQIEIL